MRDDIYCRTCKDTGIVTIRVSDEDFEDMPCPDCDRGLPDPDDQEMPEK